MAEEDEGDETEWFTAPWIFSISWILVLLSIVCSVGSWIFVFYYRKKPIVKIGQPEFLYSLCFGSLLIPIASVFGLAVSFFDEKNGTTSYPVDSKTGIIFNVCCNIWGWLMYVGLAVMYTALLCKIYRIMKVTEQPLRRGLKILPRHVIWPLVLVVSLMVFLLGTWSATGSSKYAVRKIRNRNDILVETGYCAISYDLTESPSKQILISLFALLQIVQLVLLILAFKIRKINQELGDSKRILWLCLWQVITFFVFLVIHIFFADDKVVLVFVINLCLYSILPVGIMIFPRIYYVWYENRHGHLPEHVVMLGGGTTTVRGVNPGAGNGTGITPPRIMRNNNKNRNKKKKNDSNKDDDNDNGDDDKNVNNNSNAAMMTKSMKTKTTVSSSTTVELELSSNNNSTVVQ